VAEAVSEPAPLNRRERRKLELRGRIVQAAAELFADQGFQQTRVADICESADVAQKTFFNHFPTKQDVLREIAGFAVDQLLLDIESARKAQSSTADRLAHFFRGLAENTAEAGPMNRELVTELVHVLNESSDKSQHARKLHDAFGAIVNAGLEAGDVTRRHDAETLTEMILGAYYVLMFNYANLDAFPIGKQAEAITRFLSDALSPVPEEE